MKKYIRILLSMAFLSFLSGSLLNAQSDYKIVQDFKAKYQELRQAITDADSLEQLSEIQSQIEDFRNDSYANKALLDKSLYPEDFNSSIENLRNALTLRKGDFTQITVLKTQVGELRVQVDELNAKNTELINKVQLLDDQSKKDKEKISQLERSIAQLKASLRQRDDLVMTMLDSLMPAAYRVKEELTAAEKQKVYSEAQKANIISNIQRAINDNIRFLEVTKLTPDDIEEIRRQERDFAKIWKNVGPKIIEIYSEKNQNVNYLKDIDAAFSRWNAAITQEAWNSVEEEFKDRGINLTKFSNGNEFVKSVSSYVNDEMKNKKVMGEEESENSYKTFADSVWFGKVKGTWVPFLEDNKMLSASEKDSIELKLSQWKDEVSGGFNWIYIVIAVLIIVILFLLTRRRSPEEPKQRNP
jgi:peptidoglycan hydrolase CwlO-like protein